ncbi:Vacuolar protein sorting-associated protein 17 [Coemansia javaensis]|uniref:Vacuolar protein sorting-associated protein 17 n=1 Tax=Coemansia javaensis TaxID=2761396 RepID=A0A9W8HFQ2_9FUNG|nr:Vacuolar protein sorting-associated protein 17 [Coemansia javaensis]
MHASEEDGPNRAQSLYASTNPFAAETEAGAQAEAEAEAEAETEPEADGSSDTGDNDDSTHPVARDPPPLLRFTVGHTVDRSTRMPGFSIDVVTNLASYKARKYTGVERSQIELERLEAHLRATYPECLVPTLGPGTTMSKYVPDFQNDRLVVQLLQQWMSRVAAHPILQQDYELRQFVEAPFAFNPALPPSASASLASLPQSSGASGFFSWGRPKQRVALGANATPFEQLLERVSANMEAFQRNLGEVRRWHGRQARARARLAVGLKDVGTKLASTGVVEHNAPLARALKRLGKCFLHVGACALTQSNLEGSRSIAVLDIYTAACDNVQRALGSRQLIFSEHQVAERQLERKRQAVAVLRASASISPDQTQETLAEFNVAKADADGKRHRADRVDRVLAADLRAFEASREGDLRAMFAALARDQLHIERQALGELRATLDLARATASLAGT